MRMIWWNNDAYKEFHKQHPMEVIDGLFETKEIPCVSHGPYNQVLRYEFGNSAYFIKRYHRWGSSLLRKWFRSRVRNEWENLIYFSRIGIPTPSLLAYGECRSWGTYQKGYLITEAVPEGKDLEAIAKEPHPLFLEREWRKAAIRQVALHLQLLHREGFTCHDLKWRNILATLTSLPTVYFFDCPLGRHRSAFSKHHGVLKDLATLDKWAKQYLSRTDRLRFYFMYQNLRTLREKDRKIIGKINDFFSRKS